VAVARLAVRVQLEALRVARRGQTELALAHRLMESFTAAAVVAGASIQFKMVVAVVAVAVPLIPARRLSVEVQRA
jgi:hypothetical protein